MRLPALLLTLLAASGCATYSERTAEFRSRFAIADFAGAEAALDRLLVDDVGVPTATVADAKALARVEEVADDDGYLLLLEKGMTRLARGDADGAIELWRRARDELDRHYVNAPADYLQSILTDDTALEYSGADYEHVMVRALLALADLTTGGADAHAYAIQIGEKQEEILGSDFGAEQGYAPRREYQRVAIGAYLEGILWEGENAPSEAALSFTRALSYSGDSPFLRAALDRARFGRYAPAGHGVVHVFRLVGRGPELVEAVHQPTDLASKLANVAITLVSDRGAALVQAPVKVPAVRRIDWSCPPLPIGISGGAAVDTVALLDVNAVAEQQLAANLPWIAARALIRRSVKAVSAAYVEEAVRRKDQKHEIAFVIGALANLAWTALERADTRNWSTLPAEIQVARLELPAGRHDLHLGPALQAPILVAAGHDTYVVVLQPSPALPGVALVDVYSRALP